MNALGSPHEYIQVQTDPVNGSHPPQATGRYYSIDRRGRQVHFRDRMDADNAPN
jgi:hypothetical protein